MVKLAILHQTLPMYMQQMPPEESRHLEVALAASDLQDFRTHLPASRARVLVLDLSLLGDTPQDTVAELERQVEPEMTLIVYAFAKWELVEALRGQRRHVLRAPISVRALRANLINLIVRNLSARAQTAAPTTPSAALPEQPAPARLFDDVQLARLQEVRSQVDCECPNQVADLVLALNAFESYSHACRNRNAADARVHAMLARVTGHARAVMEQALRELCRFEQIDVDALPQRAVSRPAGAVPGQPR